MIKFFLLLYPGAVSFETVVLNIQVSTQMAEADLQPQRTVFLTFSLFIGIYQLKHF